MPVRTRRQPERTCISCRETQSKRTLVRLVRTPLEDGVEGSARIALDETGRANGRGAYLCTRPECWQRALKSGALSRALRATLSAEDRQLLEAFAERLQPASP